MPTLFIVDTKMTMCRNYKTGQLIVQKRPQTLEQTYITIAINLIKDMIQEIYNCQPGVETLGLLDKIGVVSQNNTITSHIPFTTNMERIQEKLNSWYPPHDVNVGLDLVNFILNGVKYATSHYGTISPISIVVITDKIEPFDLCSIKCSLADHKNPFASNTSTIPDNVFLTLIGLESDVDNNASNLPIVSSNFDSLPLNSVKIKLENSSHFSDVNSNVHSKSGSIQTNTNSVNTNSHNNHMNAPNNAWDNRNELTLNNTLKERVNLILAPPNLDEPSLLSYLKHSLKTLKFFKPEKIEILCGNLKSSTCFLYPKLNHLKS